MPRMSLNSKPIHLSFPEPVIEQMKAAAAAEHKTLSAYIGELFKKAQSEQPKRRTVRS